MKNTNIKANVKQQEIKELVAVLLNSHKNYLQNLKDNLKRAYIFHLILVCFPSSLILSVKNREDSRVFT